MLDCPYFLARNINWLLSYIFLRDNRVLSAGLPFSVRPGRKLKLTTLSCVSLFKMTNLCRHHVCLHHKVIQSKYQDQSGVCGKHYQWVWMKGRRLLVNCFCNPPQLNYLWVGWSISMLGQVRYVLVRKQQLELDMDWFQIGKGVRQGCILLPC